MISKGSSVGLSMIFAAARVARASSICTRLAAVNGRCSSQRRAASSAAVAGGSALLGEALKAAGRNYCKFTTTTDFAGKVNDSVSPLSEAPFSGIGWTEFGLSKVLCASIAGALKPSAFACRTLAPTMRTDTGVARLESRLSSAIAIAPAAVRAAEMLSAGTVVLPSE